MNWKLVEQLDERRWELQGVTEFSRQAADPCVGQACSPRGTVRP